MGPKVLGGRGEGGRVGSSKSYGRKGDDFVRGVFGAVGFGAGQREVVWFSWLVILRARGGVWVHDRILEPIPSTIIPAVNPLCVRTIECSRKLRRENRRTKIRHRWHEKKSAFSTSSQQNEARAGSWRGFFKFPATNAKQNDYCQDITKKREQHSIFPPNSNWCPLIVPPRDVVCALTIQPAPR